MFPRILEHGAFNAHGSVRNFGQIGFELPSAFIVASDEQEYPTKEAALAAGLSFTRREIDKARQKMNKA